MTTLANAPDLPSEDEVQTQCNSACSVVPLVLLAASQWVVASGAFLNGSDHLRIHSQQCLSTNERSGAIDIYDAVKLNVLYALCRRMRTSCLAPSQTRMRRRLAASLANGSEVRFMLALPIQSLSN